MARPAVPGKAEAMDLKSRAKCRKYLAILAAYAAIILFFSTNVYLLRPYRKEQVSYFRSLV